MNNSALDCILCTSKYEVSSINENIRYCKKCNCCFNYNKYLVWTLLIDPKYKTVFINPQDLSLIDNKAVYCCVSINSMLIEIYYYDGSSNNPYNPSILHISIIKQLDANIIKKLMIRLYKNQIFN